MHTMYAVCAPSTFPGLPWDGRSYRVLDHWESKKEAFDMAPQGTVVFKLPADYGMGVTFDTLAKPLKRPPRPRYLRPNNGMAAMAAREALRAIPERRAKLKAARKQGLRSWAREGLRQATTGQLDIALKVLRNPSIPANLSTLSEAKLRKLKAQIAEKRSLANQALIDAGRGHETTLQLRQMRDALAVKFNDLVSQAHAVDVELESRGLRRWNPPRRRNPALGLGDRVKTKAHGSGIIVALRGAGMADVKTRTGIIRQPLSALRFDEDAYGERPVTGYQSEWKHRNPRTRGKARKRLTPSRR